MLKLLFSLAVALAAVAAPPVEKASSMPVEKASSMPVDNATVPGGNVPEFNAIKWYNTAPLALEDLKGKAVLLQVFRTW